jgi:hypothetical protein
MARPEPTMRQQLASRGGFQTIAPGLVRIDLACIVRNPFDQISHLTLK